MSAPVQPGASAPVCFVTLARGPAAPFPLPQARLRVLTRAGPLAPETITAHRAPGRILARAVLALEPSPAADLSAVDGYAIGADAAAISDRFVVRAETAAGATPAPALQAGDTVRVFTGAPLPPGTQRVLKSEHVTCDGAVITVRQIEAPHHCRRRGENHAAGDEVLPAGTCLGPLELALLAAAGESTVTVTRSPRVAHLVLGSELVSPDAVPRFHQVRDANSALIAALAVDAGAQLVAQRRVPDDFAAARAVIESFPAHDVLLLSGGAGNGRYDIACALLDALGYQREFRSINLRPGKPLAFAHRDATLAFALPGNPVSHWATWHLFVGPALRRMAGHVVPLELPRRSGRLETPWRTAAEEREVFWPARVTAGRTGWSVRPLRFANSGDLAGVTGANALLCGGATGGAWAAGDAVEFISCP